MTCCGQVTPDSQHAAGCEWMPALSHCSCIYSARCQARNRLQTSRGRMQLQDYLDTSDQDLLLHTLLGKRGRLTVDGQRGRSNCNSMTAHIRVTHVRQLGKPLYDALPSFGLSHQLSQAACMGLDSTAKSSEHQIPHFIPDIQLLCVGCQRDCV